MNELNYPLIYQIEEEMKRKHKKSFPKYKIKREENLINILSDRIEVTKTPINNFKDRHLIYEVKKGNI
ncbi:MAG: hypothetical protein QF567_01770 [Candidatus Pacearchaeota archaeon]|jgi:hypothetical protein|nr:hypothetical protein [Candidatus Pacearchaeota archaeon]